MTTWKCPVCGNMVLQLSEDDPRLACMGYDCDFFLDIYKKHSTECSDSLKPGDAK